MTHVHIDIEELRKQAEELCAKIDAVSDAAIAAGKADAVYIMAQRRFSRSRIEMNVAAAECLNDGTPPDVMLEAMGLVMGQLIGGLVRSFNNDHGVTLLVMESIGNGINRVLMKGEGIPPGSAAYQEIAVKMDHGGQA